MAENRPRYTAEFKAEAIRQVLERGHKVRHVAKRLGVSAWSLHQWLRQHRERLEPKVEASSDLAAENRRLKAELERVTEERDILKKATAYFAKQSR